MKFIKKLTAIILTLAIGISVCVPSVATEEVTAQPMNFEDYREIIEDGGYPSLTTSTFLKIAKIFDWVYRFLTGRAFQEKEYFNFKADETLTEICDFMAEESGFDLLMLIEHFPETNQYAEFVVETFNVDTTAMREEFYRLRHEQDEQGNVPGAILFYFLGMYMSVIESCEAHCKPLEQENCYEIFLLLTTRDGYTEDVGTGIALNTETGEIYAKDNDNGFMGIGFNFSATELLLYAQVNVWMRDFGFTVLYDVFCHLTPFFNYSTRRIKFDYDGLEWMIQTWKGNYLVSNGAEVGIYTREPGSKGTFYNCANDEQMMNMSMKLSHRDDIIFERNEMSHWWLTGFKISRVLYPAHELTLDYTIEMKDEAMLAAFCEAIDNHYRDDMTYTVDGLKVNVIW